MKAIKLEIYLPQNKPSLRDAFRQYLNPHALHLEYTHVPSVMVVVAEKSAALVSALSAAIAYAESKTSTPIIVVTIPCTIFKE